MKSTSGCDDPNTNATNSSGFTGIPGGYRSYLGSFYNIGKVGNWWSSTEGRANNACYRYMIIGLDDVVRNYNEKAEGFSIRCLRD